MAQSSSAAIAAAAAIAAKISASLNTATSLGTNPSFAAFPAAPAVDVNSISDPVERARAIARSLAGVPVAGVKRPREEDGSSGGGGGGGEKKKRKIYVPSSQPTNWVGVFLGPRGSTQKGLESESGCRVLVRGKGSKATGDEVEDNDDLHVLLMAESDEAVSGRRERACYLSAWPRCPSFFFLVLATLSPPSFFPRLLPLALVSAAFERRVLGPPNHRKSGGGEELHRAEHRAAIHAAAVLILIVLILISLSRGQQR